MGNNGKSSAAAGKIKSRDYKCIFFDLDHTLWDYECNARETLRELHTHHNLAERGIGFDDFHRHFTTINFHLWELYDSGKIDNTVIREQRFQKVLAEFYVEDQALSDLAEPQLGLDQLEGDRRAEHDVTRLPHHGHATFTERRLEHVLLVDDGSRKITATEVWKR